MRYLLDKILGKVGRIVRGFQCEMVIISWGDNGLSSNQSDSKFLDATLTIEIQERNNFDKVAHVYFEHQTGGDYKIQINYSTDTSDYYTTDGNQHNLQHFFMDLSKYISEYFKVKEV